MRDDPGLCPRPTPLTHKLVDAFYRTPAEALWFDSLVESPHLLKKLLELNVLAQKPAHRLEALHSQGLFWI